MIKGIPRQRAAIDSALDRFAMMRRGKFDLSWMRANPRGWGTRARPSAVGVTLADIGVGPYAEPPDRVRSGGGAAPRGAEPLPGTVVTPYDVCEKAQVWADNVAELYEEGASRHWSSARDIPWGKLTELDDDLERAICQLCTQLAQMEIIALEFPARWIPRVSREFHEVKILLAMHAADEARHLEVFRKRALVNGGGLLQASPRCEDLGRLIVDAPSCAVANTLMHILFEGFTLTLFRHGEFLAPTEVEQRIFQYCMQDEARHVAYGVRHLKQFLARHPERDRDIHAVLDVGEEAIFALSLEPQTIEPRALLAGGGVDRMGEGLELMADLHRTQVKEYLHRLELAGIDRSSRCRIPPGLPR